MVQKVAILVSDGRREMRMNGYGERMKSFQQKLLLEELLKFLKRGKAIRLQNFIFHFVERFSSSFKIFLVEINSTGN